MAKTQSGKFQDIENLIRWLEQNDIHKCSSDSATHKKQVGLVRHAVSFLCALLFASEEADYRITGVSLNQAYTKMLEQKTPATKNEFCIILQKALKDARQYCLGG